MSLIQKFSSGDVVENRYHLDIRLHEGRWGDIYRATDRLNDRPVAVRFFPTSDDGPADFERFTAHARELSGLTAPSIAVPIDHGMDREVPFLVFRWAHGQDLQGRLAERGPLSFEQTLTVLEKILHGLGQAHQSHLTHGLIRPVKIAVDDIDSDDPFVKLVDFQIWRFFEWSSGKEAFAEENLSRRIVRYTAPEVLDEYRVKPVTDVYATGLITIEMLTGEPAFDDNHRVALIARQMSDELAELDNNHRAGTAFRAFLTRLLAKDPKERFPTAMKALSAFRDERDSFLSEPSFAQQSAAEEAASAEAFDEPAESGEFSPSRPERVSDNDGSELLPDKEDRMVAEDKADKRLDDAEEPSPLRQEEVDPDAELFEGDPANMRSLTDGRTLDEDSDELFDDAGAGFLDEDNAGFLDEDSDEFLDEDSDGFLDEDSDEPFFDDASDFGDFYNNDTVSKGADAAQASSSPSPTLDDEELELDVVEEISTGNQERSHTTAPAPEPASSAPASTAAPEARTKPPSGASSDTPMGTYVAIVFAMVATMAAGVYFIAFYDTGDDPPQDQREPSAAVEEEQDEEPDPITIDTIPPAITVTIDSPTEQLVESRSTLEFTEYSDEDFPLTISARRGESERSIVLEEYTAEVLIELDD